jgi:WD40 repeat protein/tRNA A-37 threonylcarbamoyl transferase component Bud32
VAKDDGEDKTVDFSTVTLGADQTTVPGKSTQRVNFVDGLEDAETEEADGTLRYLRQGLLGQGGSGVVISVYDKKMRRPVALKLASSTNAEREAELRFLREAQVTGQLTHPNVMPVYDIGTDIEGHVFFTMKRVEGHSLRQLLNDGNAGSLVERLLVFRQICNALAFAHSRGVLHRDLKPANVMVGQFGEVLVVDWGLCKVLGEKLEGYGYDAPDLNPSSLITHHGAVAGTPAYMAPEQARGEIDALDPTTDIYSLGAMLYTLLTEVSPFNGSTVDVIREVIAGNFIPPAKRAPGKVPREMNAIVMKAMAFEQKDRYPNVSALSADVQAFIEGKRVSVVKYSPLQRLGKWAARKRNVVRPVAFTVAFAFVLLVSGGIVHLNRLGHARDAAVAEAARASQAEREAQVEAVNGRAAVGTAEALYGRAGVALEQLEQVRSEMVALDTDTVRADIGIGLLTRAALLPGVHLKFEQLVRSGRFSDDGSAFFVMTSGALLAIDFQTGAELGRWEKPWRGGVLGPVEDGVPWLLKGKEDGVHGFHLPTGKRRHWVVPEGECTTNQVVSNDGWLSAGCAGRGLMVWAWDQPDSGHLYAFQDTNMEVVELSDDGRRVLVTRFHEFKLRQDAFAAVIQNGRLIWEDHTRGGGFGLSPDGEWILKTTATGFQVTHIDSGLVHSAQSKVIGTINWHANSRQVLLAFQEGAVKVFDVGRDGVHETHGYRLALKGGVHSLFADSNLQHWVHIDRGDVRVFGDREIGGPLVDLQLDEASIAVSESIRSDSGDLIAVGTENGHIFVLDRHTGAMLWDLYASPRPTRGLSFLPSGTGLVSAHWDGKARVWDLKTGEVERVFEPTHVSTNPVDAKVTEVNVLNGGRVLLACGDGQIGIWSLSTGELLKDLTGAVDYVWDSAWSPVTGRLVVSNRKSRVSGVAAAIFDLESGELLKKIEGYHTAAYGIDISPDGERFMVAQHAYSALVLDKDGELVAELNIHTPPALEMSWSSDGTLVATSDYSGKFQIWTTHNWAPVASVGLDDLVSGLVFDADRRFLLAVTYSGEIHELNLGGRSMDWMVTVRVDGEPVDESALHAGAWRRAATAYNWPRAVAELEAAIAAGLSVSPITLARHRFAAGDRSGALAALGTGGADDGLTGVWRGALEAQGR